MTSRPTDLELVQRYLEQGDQNAFVQLYRTYGEDVRRAMARALTGFPSAEIDEFSQELWARGPALFQPWEPQRGSLRTYLVVQATWAARSAEAKRMRRHAARRAAQLPSGGADPGAARCMSAWSLENADGAETALWGDAARKVNATQMVSGYLKTFDDRPARVLQAWIDGWSGREIAKSLGVHPAQVSRDLARARARMEEVLPAGEAEDSRPAPRPRSR